MPKTQQHYSVPDGGQTVLIDDDLSLAYAIALGGDGSNNLPTNQPSVSSNIYNEVPIGLINNINKKFFTLNPFKIKTTRLYFNGLRQKLNVDYIENPSEMFILFIIAPEGNTELIIDYEI